jgi:replicative DNA helicase
MSDIQKLYSEDAEKSLIGALLIDPRAFIEVGPVVKSADFYIQKYAWIYEAVATIRENGGDADIVTISEALGDRLGEIGGFATLSDLMNYVPSALHAVQYAEIVAERAQRRRLLAAASEIARLAHDDARSIADAQSAAEALLMSARGGDPGDVVDAAALFSLFYDQVAAWADDPDAARGLATGLQPLDALLGGIEAGLYLLASRTSGGKTALALQIAANVARRGDPVLVFSLEMSARQVVERLAVGETAISSRAFRAGLAGDDMLRLADVAGRAAGWPLHLIGAGAFRTPGDVRAIIQRQTLREGAPSLIIIDYLGLMQSSAREETRNLELGAIARDLLLVAQETDTPVLAIHQLSRGVETRADKRPMLSDLRESGQLEEHADVVLMLYREGMYDPESPDANVLEIWLRKNRLTGPAGACARMYWDAKTARAKRLSHSEQGAALGF